MNAQKRKATGTLDFISPEYHISTADQLCQVKAVISCINGLITYDRHDLQLQENELLGLGLILDGVNRSIDQTIEQL